MKSLKDVFESIIEIINEILEALMKLFSDGADNPQPFPCIGDHDQITIDITSLRVYGPYETQDAIDKRDNKFEFIGHSLALGEDLLDDPLFTGFLWPGLDNIFECPEPPPPPPGGGGGGSGGGSGSRSLPSFPSNIPKFLTPEIMFIMTCNDRIHNALPSTKWNERKFISICMFKSNYQAMFDHYSGHARIRDRFIKGPFTDSFTITSGLAVKVTILKAKRHVFRIAYRDSTKINTNLRIV